MPIERRMSRDLFERLQREEHSTVGVDPDGTAYLDAVDRVEEARAAYRASLDEEERSSGAVEDHSPSGIPIRS